MQRIGLTQRQFRDNGYHRGPDIYVAYRSKPDPRILPVGDHHQLLVHPPQHMTLDLIVEDAEDEDIALDFLASHEAGSLELSRTGP